MNGVRFVGVLTLLLVFLPLALSTTRMGPTELSISALHKALASPGVPILSDGVYLDRDWPDSLNLRSLVVASRLSEEQVCVSTGDFSDGRAFTNLASDLLLYVAEEKAWARVQALCDNGLRLQDIQVGASSNSCACLGTDQTCCMVTLLKSEQPPAYPPYWPDVAWSLLPGLVQGYAWLVVLFVLLHFVFWKIGLKRFAAPINYHGWLHRLLILLPFAFLVGFAFFLPLLYMGVVFVTVGMILFPLSTAFQMGRLVMGIYVSGSTTDWKRHLLNLLFLALASVCWLVLISLVVSTWHVPV